MVARIAMLLVVLSGAPASAAAETGEVVGVTDGDTITVLVGERSVKVRLAEVDAPERGQPYWRRSKQQLSDAVFGRTVRLEPVDTDRWGRMVAQVYVGERHVNRELVRQGAVWVFRRYLRDPTLLDDEADARRRGVGVWSSPELHPRLPDPGTDGRTRSGDREPESPPPDARSPDFTCGTKTRCGEMTSCGEARFHLEACGLTRLDGDADGVPCESICR